MKMFRTTGELLETDYDCVIYTSSGELNDKTELIFDGEFGQYIQSAHPWLPFMIGDEIYFSNSGYKEFYNYRVEGPINLDHYDIYTVQHGKKIEDSVNLDFFKTNMEQLLSKIKNYQKILIFAPIAEDHPGFNDLENMLRTMLTSKYTLIYKGGK